MDLTKESLHQETDAVLDALTHPIFLAQMQAFRETPVEDRFAMAAAHLTPAALVAQGVPMPAQMRVSSRVFEEGPDGNRANVNVEEGKRLVSLINMNDPDALIKLKAQNPDLFADMDNILNGGAYTPGYPVPNNWVQMPKLDPEVIIAKPKKIDEQAAWGCGCAGAGTVCGGAGGGS